MTRSASRSVHSKISCVPACNCELHSRQLAGGLAPAKKEEPKSNWQPWGKGGQQAAAELGMTGWKLLGVGSNLLLMQCP